MIELTVAPHPSLALFAFETRFPAPLSETPSPPALVAFLTGDVDAPVQRSEELRKDVRDVLRHGGYKPTGRGKPACEYLVKAAPLRSINLAVDACNAVSLHSGLPVSVIDVDRVEPPLRVAIVEGDMRYVFNASGQEMRVEGLLCLHDADGPCANAVKDSQRTKTHDGTTRTLSLIWGPALHGEHVQAAGAWYRQLLGAAGATTADVAT